LSAHNQRLNRKKGETPLKAHTHTHTHTQGGDG